MNYIGYKELDKLLYKLPQLRAKVQNLRIEIAKLQTEGMEQELQDDILYSLYIGNRELTDMPHGSSLNPVDKLLRAIQRKDRIAEELYPGDLVNMCVALADAVNKVEIALQCLDAQETEIITLRYFQGLEWKEVHKVIGVDPSWLGQYKKTAVEKMAGVLFMEPEQWEYCMEQVR